MQGAVRGSVMGLRLLWIINLVLGIYVAFVAAKPGGLTPIHMGVGILIVALLWFLGVAQGLAGGSLVLTLVTFVIGLALPIIGIAQLAASGGAGNALQGLHVVLAISAIALGEISGSRYRKSVAAAAK